MKDKLTIIENSICWINGDSITKLDVMDIFIFFVRGKSIKDKPRTDFVIDAPLKDVRFKKAKHNIKCVLTQNEQHEITTSFFLVNMKKEVLSKISSDLLKDTIDSEYILINHTFYPISDESINELNEVIHESKYGANNIKLGTVFNFIGLNSSPYIDSNSINIDLLFNDSYSKNDYGQTNPIFKLDLYDYQEEGLKWLKFCGVNKIGTILGDDMGLGKTAQVIAFICWAIEVNMFHNFLIVVPSTLLENWRREFLFFTKEEIEPYIHHGNNRTGFRKVLESKKIVITTYSLIINDSFLFREIGWGAYILDEASLIKNYETERTIAIKAIPAKLRIAMTGTPVENSLLDLWSLSDFCNPGYLATIQEFKSIYVNSTIEANLNNANLNRLKLLTNHIMIRRMKEDILKTLPDKIDIHQALSHSPAEYSEYENLRDEILSNAFDKKGVIFELIRKLYCFCAHPILLQDKKTLDVSELKKMSTKYRRTIEILDEIHANGEKVLIFTNIIPMIDLLQESLSPLYGVQILNIDGRIPITERQTIIDEFSKKNGFGILVLNPKTAGMGLNITAANHVIHYSRQWNPALEMQASARAYRNGQKKGVNIYYPFYVNSIEETIDNRLRQKMELSDSVIDVTSDKENELEHIYNLLKNQNYE